MSEAKKRYYEKLKARHGWDAALDIRIRKMCSRMNTFRLREYLKSSPIYAMMLREAHPEYYAKLIGY